MRSSALTLNTAAAAAAVLLIAVHGCSQDSETTRPAPPTTGESPSDSGSGAPTDTKAPEPAAEAEPKNEPTQDELVASGKSTYMTYCIACHNADPRRPGGIGPEIADASLELLEARVVRGIYPDGYTPKRDTQAMVPLPHLAPEIPALHAYLMQAAKGG